MTLYELKNRIKKIPPVQKVLSKVLDSPQVVRFVYPLINRLRIDEFSRQPSVAKSRQFFREHTAEVQQVLSLLADKKSKKIFRNQIRYLCGVPIFPVGTPQDRYFPDFIRLGKEEVFVDCGAFDGDSIEQFRRACRDQYKKIVALEPSPELFKQLTRRQLKRCVCLQQGAWSHTGTLTFLAGNKETDLIEQLDTSGKWAKEKTVLSVSVDALDNIPACADMTYLKMDIEGAEKEALKGAEKTIRAQQPTLAISIYHSDEDLLHIPLWIASLHLPYKYYARLHSWPNIDMVWYAVPTGKTTVREP